MHFFVSNPGLSELTAVIWAACVLCLCTVQVPCYQTWGEAFPTSAGLAGVGSTSPARGRPVADMLLCLLAALVYAFR
jgi:hypothetical protein